MENTLISVIIPVYNVQPYLERCVSSVCSQTYSNLQIVLVDDGSTDESGSLCDKLSEADSRIQVIHKDNGGLSDARNAGLEMAKGEYISFVDSDDWLEPEFFELLLCAILRFSADIAGCEYRRCSVMEPFDHSSEEGRFIAYDRITAMEGLIVNQIQQVVWNKLYVKSILRGLRFEKGKYHEDEFWSYQVFARIRKYVSVDYVGYHYFQRTDSIMGEKYSLKRLDAVKAKVLRQKYLNNSMPELAVVGRRNLFFTCLYHGQSALKDLSGNERKEAIRYLRKVIYVNRMNQSERLQLKISHRIWVFLAERGFSFCCRIRNLLKLGI